MGKTSSRSGRHGGGTADEDGKNAEDDGANADEGGAPRSCGEQNYWGIHTNWSYLGSPAVGLVSRCLSFMDVTLPKVGRNLRRGEE